MQRRSFDVLFGLLKNYGSLFSEEKWKQVFTGVIKQLFDEMQFIFQTKRYHNEDAYIMVKNHSSMVFKELVDIVIINFPVVRVCLKDFL